MANYGKSGERPSKAGQGLLRGVGQAAAQAVRPGLRLNGVATEVAGWAPDAICPPP